MTSHVMRRAVLSLAMLFAATATMAQTAADAKESHKAQLQESKTQFLATPKASQPLYAAGHFTAWYRTQGKVFADVCQGMGVDISPYVDAFQTRYAPEYAQAMRHFAAVQVSEEQLSAAWEKRRPATEAGARGTIHTIATTLHLQDDKAACDAMRAQPARFVSLLDYAGNYPEIEAVLMAQ